MNEYRSKLLETISIWNWTPSDNWLPIFEEFKKFKETNDKYPSEARRSQDNTLIN